MSVAAANLVVDLVLAYLAVGALFAVPFVVVGAGRVDEDARAGSVGFRLIILPGVVALWPVLALRWLRGPGGVEESSPHRRAARGEEAGA